MEVQTQEASTQPPPEFSFTATSENDMQANTPNLPAEAAPRKAPLVSGNAVRAIVPTTIDEVYRLSKVIAMAQWAPKSYLIDPKTPGRGYDENKIMLGIMHGMELGLTAVASLQSIAVINGSPSIWGDGALAVVQASGLLENFKETPLLDAKGNVTGYQCAMKRKGIPTPTLQQFTEADARRAGLLDKSGPWQQYRSRMYQMRARAWAMRDCFADVLRGLSIAEEAMDIPITGEAASPSKVSKLHRATNATAALDAFASPSPPANAAPEETVGTTAGESTDGNQANPQG